MTVFSQHTLKPSSHSQRLLFPRSQLQSPVTPFLLCDTSHVLSIPPIPYANTSSSHYLMSRPFQGPLSPTPKLHVTLPPPHYSSKLLPSCDFTVQNPLMTTQCLLNTAQLSRTTFRLLFNLIQSSFPNALLRTPL